MWFLRRNAIGNLSHSHRFIAISMPLFPLPFSFPWHIHSQSYTNENPMGPVEFQSFPFPYTSLILNWHLFIFLSHTVCCLCYMQPNQFRSPKHFQNCGWTLDDCIKRAIIKNFKVRDSDNIDVIRLNCDLPHISTMIERRRLKFVNKLLDCSCWTFFYLPILIEINCV